MEEFKSNSDKSRRKEEREKVEKVVSQPVKVAKRTELQKFTDKAITEDVTRIKSWFFGEVALPKIKRVIWDIVRDALEGATQQALDSLDFRMNGESKWSSNRSVGKNRVRRSYDRYYEDRDSGCSRERRRDYAPSRSYGTYDYCDIIFPNRGEAERVLDEMDRRIQKNGVVSVMDLYDMVDCDSNWASDKYGWMDLHGAGVERARGGGYRLVLPRALPLD